MLMNTCSLSSCFHPKPPFAMHDSIVISNPKLVDFYVVFQSMHDFSRCILHSYHTLETTLIFSIDFVNLVHVVVVMFVEGVALVEFAMLRYEPCLVVIVLRLRHLSNVIYASEERSAITIFSDGRTKNGRRVE